MTMPSERTRALIWAAEFLREVRHRSDMPDDIRRQAHTILRHYPEVSSIESQARIQEHYSLKSELRSTPWLLPADYYDRKNSGAAIMKNASMSEAYEELLAKEVQEAIDDPRPSLSHAQVLAEFKSEVAELVKQAKARE